MERTTCIGRVWIFLLLGVLLLIFSLVITGIYFNVQSITTSSEYTEIIPLYINAGAVALSGCLVAVLFWRRWKLLVFVTVVVSVATGFLCCITGVLTATHIVRPIQSFTSCRFYTSQQLCQCISHYVRDMLSLEYSDTEETTYNFEGAGSCESVQDVLPGLLYVQIVVCAAVFLVAVAAAILSLLVLRAERNKRGLFQNESYDDVFTITGSSVSSQNQSDSEPEVIAEVTPAPAGQGLLGNRSQLHSNTNTANKNTSLCHSNARNCKLPSNSSHRESINSSSALLGNCGNSTLQSNSAVPPSKPLVVPRAKTPTVDSSTGSKHLNSRSVVQDRDLNIHKQISKSQDREVGRRRRNSLTNLKRLSRSCDSLDTTGNDEENENCGTTQSDGKTKGKLKAHRRKSRRAVTLHNLDSKQLALIYNLQMRYMQETKDFHSQKELSTSANPRRAITPQPSTQTSVLPPSVRSHTPQPYKTNSGQRAQQEREFYEQIALLNTNFHDHSNVKNKCSKENFNEFVARHQVEQNAAIVREQKTHQTAPVIRGYNPYFQQHNVNSDNIYQVTYSDNMLNGTKPKSRASAQDYFLPPRPLHRHNQNHSLPPQPIRRQGSIDSSLPPEPIHRGKSAFQVVETQRGPHNLSSSDQNIVTSTPRRKQRRDYAEVAIRDNFKMNQSPFLFNGSDLTMASLPQGQARDPSEIYSTRANRNDVPDILPPYSGPPSYREFVSSCDQSQTSSLSSNSEDIYSKPLSRNMGSNSQNVDHIQAGHTQRQNTNLQNIYGNFDPENPNIMAGHQEVARVQMSEHGQEVVYTSPIKSKVKQCIVPEDYYSQIDKTNRRPKDIPMYENAEPHRRGTQFNYAEYGNVAVTAGSGYSGQFSPMEKHQIAPDAKYHEYEDVYDDADPKTVHLTTGPNIPNMEYTANIPNINIRMKPRKINEATNAVSPRKVQHQPVSNVSSVCNAAHIAAASSCVNTQVSESVENVHAKNFSKIPAIKLNDGEDDDEVFVDENIYGNKRNPNCAQSVEQKIKKPVLQEAQTGINKSMPLSNETSDENSNLKSTDGNEVKFSSNLKSTNPEEDYMKMSLPGRGTDNYSHMIISSNKNKQKSHVTASSNETKVHDNVRCGPDGRDSSINSTDLTDDLLSSEEEGAITGV